MNRKLVVSLIVGVSAIMMIVFYGATFLEITPVTETIQNNSEITVYENEILQTNGVKHLVPLDEIKGGGPPKDGIPSIDNPRFVNVEDVQFLSDEDMMVGLTINGESRAYPLSILVWHEIVNDRFGLTPVAVTYCPLCYTTQVFDRTINGQETEFGTSGKLYNSNLVMYDRMTETYWSQSLGIAIKGELTGTTLTKIPFDLMKWKDWKREFPNSVVLSTDTGYSRAYDVDPYGDYYTESRILFPVSNQDSRMHEKEFILGFGEGNSFKAYKQQDVEDAKIVNDTVGNQAIMLVSLFDDNSRAFDRTVNGEILEFELQNGKINDVTTNSEWNYDGLAIDGKLQGEQLKRIVFDPSFWFEWIAIHPETEVYER